MKIIKRFDSSIDIIEGEPRCITARISTAAMDRDGEVVVPTGCNSKEFEAAPSVFFQHDFFSGMPIGKCVELRREEGAIIAKTEFASRPDDYPVEKEWLPDTLLSLYKQGVMKGWSIGFSEIESRQATDADRARYGKSCKRIFSKWNLLEYSAVSMPSNQEALTVAIGKGLKISSGAASALGLHADPPVQKRQPTKSLPQVVHYTAKTVKQKSLTASATARIALAKSRGLSTAK